MGGLITIQTLMSVKDNELPNVVVLSSPCLGLANEPPFSKKIASNILNVIYPSLRFPSGVRTGSGTRDASMRARDLSDSLLIKRVSVRWYKELRFSITKAHLHAGDFPDVPLLVSQGGNDLIVKKESVVEWFNKLTVSDKYYKEWDGLYHEVLNEPEKEKVLAHMLGFVTIHLSC